MGYDQHDAILVTTFTTSWESDDGLPDIEAFRESIPKEFRQLVIGPVRSAINGWLHYVLLPDGSKEGWDVSNEGDEIRRRFLDLFSRRYDDGSSRHEWVHVTYGSSHRSYHGVSVEPPEARVIAASPDAGDP